MEGGAKTPQGVIIADAAIIRGPPGEASPKAGRWRVVPGLRLPALFAAGLRGRRAGLLRVGRALPFRRLILLELDFLPALLVGVVLLADGGERLLLLGEQRGLPRQLLGHRVEFVLHRRGHRLGAASQPCAFQILLAACHVGDVRADGRQLRLHRRHRSRRGRRRSPLRC